jgi:hypothetical protein
VGIASIRVGLLHCPVGIEDILFHEGQLDGRKVRLPVFLGRRSAELADRELQRFYKKLPEVLGRESGATYGRNGDEIALHGLNVDLGPWNFHLLRCRRTKIS